jgi:hypothetical protein
VSVVRGQEKEKAVEKVTVGNTVERGGRRGNALRRTTLRGFYG